MLSSTSMDGSDDKYSNYLLPTKQTQSLSRVVSMSVGGDTMSPRERHRNREQLLTLNEMDSSLQNATRVSVIASMVPDEIINQHSDHAVRRYEAALMFIDVSGFTDLCETYTKAGRGGPSRLTQVLNSYIGSMVQEILTHDGDVLKFSGDAFLSMWKKTSKMTLQDVVHTAIDCGLSVQKNYGTYLTDVGVTLKVKVAISAGISHFSIIGGATQCSYVIIGPPVWDVKMAEYVSTAGDVLVSASAWKYVNEAEYFTQPSGDGKHTKVLGVGVSWKRVEKIEYALGVLGRDTEPTVIYRSSNSPSQSVDIETSYYREFSLRPAVVSAIRSTWWPSLRQFMTKPVLRAVDNDEPMEFLAEVRRVVIVFLNIITKTVSEELLINIVDTSYKYVCSVTSSLGGLVNKVSMFDKDMMFLVVFGLRGLKHEDEAQNALQCALTLKENLNDHNITSVSIGVTSGSTYCGVVGHVLRREYTVIGSAVNKAARLMMVYPDKITCDKETFLRSKLDQEFFCLMEPRPLKGIRKPGPVYEFSKIICPERENTSRHPLLGRNEELRKYKVALRNAIKQQNQKFTRYRDHVFGMAFLGPESVGKTRLMEECITITPKFIKVAKIILKNSNKTPYELFRRIAERLLPGPKDITAREKFDHKIRHNLDISNMDPVQLYAFNTIFGCRFPLPEKFSFSGDILEDQPTKNSVREIFRTNENLTVVAIDNGIHADDESWRLLLILMDVKAIFVIINVGDDTNMSETAYLCLCNSMLLKLRLGGIERWYHAALACQLLDVQAIPADLEKIIQSASGGMPGWIQNFVISLVQREFLSVTTVTRREALEAGAVMPPLFLMYREIDSVAKFDSLTEWMDSGFQDSNLSLINQTEKEDQTPADHATEIIQMAVLAESYDFEDMKVDMTMDAIILKTYDSLTPFEKKLLKCSSVLGDVFSRRMLQHLLQSDSPRKVAKAVAKLFEIRVLECEGGDFTRETSMVLVHPAPALPAAKPPYCACLGVRKLPDCRDLPMYAFCGYMKFKHSLFRITTYDLLTEGQKHEMHVRALLYLERYTRRCIACGAGCYNRLLGERSDDGLINESEDLKKTRHMIQSLAAESLVPGEHAHLPTSCFANTSQDTPVHTIFLHRYSGRLTENEEMARLRESAAMYRKEKHVRHVRSFSSLELARCECLPIILSVYCQIIDHCRGAGEYEKLFEAYLEYADLCLMNSNIPQAIRLLFEVEAFVTSDKYLSKVTNKIGWLKDFRLARILSLRGACMLESGDLSEARKHLFHAMELYCVPFPTTRYSVKFRDMKASMHQAMALYVAPNLYEATDSGVVGNFYEEIADTLNRLYKLFSECEEERSASLAAKWSFQYALRTNSNFRLLCDSYGNLITICRHKQKFSKCLKLEKRAMDLCHRKRCQLDIAEVRAVCYLYTSIFLFYIEYGKKNESLEFGLSVMHMISNLTDSTTRQLLILWMLKLLLCDLRISDMVVLMREFFYLTDQYDLSSITWYHFYSMVILLDTGFCVESYQTCEKFYIKKGDAILRSKTPDAAWNFFVCMWLITIRTGAWERSILWEDKIKHLLSLKFKKHEFNILLLVRLVEGLLIMLVREIDNRNIKRILILQKTVKSMFQDMYSACQETPMYRPRYSLLRSYYYFIQGKKFRAYTNLSKTFDLAKHFAHGTILIWAEHTRKHWKGVLNPALEDYWVEHVEPDNLLDYRDFNPAQGKQIIPYTLPLPKYLAR